VHEQTTWFGDQGDAGFNAAVDVGDRAEADAATVVAIAPPPPLQAPLERASRRMLWRAAVLAWREHPLLGLGPDNFRRAYNRYLGLARPDERLHANNFYFETLASLGIAGIGALVLLVVGVAGAARTAIRHHGAASVAGLIVAGAAIGLAAYLVHGFFDYFLEFTPTYALLWLLAGIVTGLAARDTAKAVE
jgi:O-antigen ligase